MLSACRCSWARWQLTWWCQRAPELLWLKDRKVLIEAYSKETSTINLRTHECSLREHSGDYEKFFNVAKLTICLLKNSQQRFDRSYAMRHVFVCIDNIHKVLLNSRTIHLVILSCRYFLKLSEVNKTDFENPRLRMFEMGACNFSSQSKSRSRLNFTDCFSGSKTDFSRLSLVINSWKKVTKCSWIHHMLK